jgi:hypothetical protein
VAGPAVLEAYARALTREARAPSANPGPSVLEPSIRMREES